MTIISRAHSHITIDDRGVARIDGTRMKVLHLAKEVLARGATAAELQALFPDLTLAQIHAALAYYYDHKAAMDAEVAREAAEYDAARSTTAETPGRQKLRQTGQRP